ncbi:MAG: hypothetical protein GY844_14805, partial [Bradyrhizobium sp.]|nr:hypothetical protein [Bradyrhizobium sp.]
GAVVTGSDRDFDRGGQKELRRQLQALGITLFAQDGSGVGADTSRLVVSGAIEEDNPELVSARAHEVPVEHRADALAGQVAGSRTLAVAGTSGKSTVTAMIFEILVAAQRSPSLITGAPLITLSRKGLVGNAFRGKSSLLVVEADESDGTLPRYHPWIGVLLNIGKDHKEIAELKELFSRFRSQSELFAANADDPGLAAQMEGALTFGFTGGDLRGEHLDLMPDGSWFVAGGVEFNVPIPGRHNAENALAAAAAAQAAGVSLNAAAAALSVYKGVARRYAFVGSARGIEVYDDYAHNPDKVRAMLAAAHLRAQRVLAVFQPHGFGPTRFLKNEFIESFAQALGPKDILWMPDIYYAGGTAVKDISSADLTGPIKERGRDARHIADRAAIP